MADGVYRELLQEADVASLALPYQLVTGKGAAGVEKQAMVEALDRAFDRELVGCHAGYLASMPDLQKMAVEDYRRSGSEFMNTALRTGRMPFELDVWGLKEALDHRAEITTTAEDAVAFKRSPVALIDALVERSGILAALKQHLHDSASASLRRWSLMAELDRAIRGAPPRAKDTVLWRGEWMRLGFHAPQGPASQSRHDHAERVAALKPGDVLMRPDFGSFSMSPVVASNFAGRGCCVFRLVLPRDVPALFMESYTRPMEFEVILPPGTAFRVARRSSVVSRASRLARMTIFHLEVVTSGSPRSGARSTPRSGR